jgi:hypothetical protein
MSHDYSQNHYGTSDEDIAMMRVDVADGKYTYIFKNGEASVLRYGEPWDRDVTGDKFVYCLASEVESLRQQLAAKQAEIDVLMLEHCPDEMTEEQLDNYDAHQKPVSESELPEAIRARATK